MQSSVWTGHEDGTSSVWGWGLELRALCLLATYSTTELQPKPDSVKNLDSILVDFDLGKPPVNG